MKIKVKVSNTLRHIVEGLPSELIVEKSEPLTIDQLAVDLKIPPVLIVNAFVDGVKCPLDFRLTKNAEVGLIGPISGG
jgi:hypothetical protein